MYVPHTFATLRCLYSSMIKCLCSFRFGSLLITKSSHLHVHPDCDPGLWISVTIYPEIPQQSFPERRGMNYKIGVVHLVSRNNQNSKKADKQGVCGGTRHRPLIQALGRQGREHRSWRSACVTNRLWGQPGLHETQSQNTTKQTKEQAMGAKDVLEFTNT